MSERLWVYIASPYTSGDVGCNVRSQHKAWDLLLNLGFVPIAPLWSHYQHLHRPRKYSDWTSYDTEIISRCDVCLRLPATCHHVGYINHDSPGADAEVSLFLSQGKTVVFSIDELLKHEESLNAVV